MESSYPLWQENNDAANATNSIFLQAYIYQQFYEENAVSAPDMSIKQCLFNLIHRFFYYMFDHTEVFGSKKNSFELIHNICFSVISMQQSVFCLSSQFLEITSLKLARDRLFWRSYGLFYGFIL